jgi:hypothetical protein
MVVSSNLVLKCAHNPGLADFVPALRQESGSSGWLSSVFWYSPIADGSGCALPDFDQDQLMRNWSGLRRGPEIVRAGVIAASAAAELENRRMSQPDHSSRRHASARLHSAHERDAGNLGCSARRR